MVKKVKWAKSAIESRKHLLQYWVERNKSTNYSIKLSKQINEKVDLLKAFPLSGKATEMENVRGLTFGHYSIFYSIHNNTIIILDIFDSRQDPKLLISKLKSTLGRV